jgi:flagellar export protein FliJ
MQGANYATVIAEHFRDRGKNVLLLMDSLTRYAMAQREIALAIGEPPATKGYPPSCFARLPQLVERSGNGVAGGGSITAFYTVLSEGDDPNDPIADAARGILDGHIVLSRELAEAGHYPAIDIERSVSRVMTNVAAAPHLEAARRFRQLHARHQKARDLIQLGAYAPGHDAELDLAVRLHEPMTRLLQQNMAEPARLDDSLAFLHACSPPDAALLFPSPSDERRPPAPRPPPRPGRAAALRRARRAAQGRDREARRRAQAEQLVAYRREYEQRWSAEFCREGKIELVRCYQGFVQRLTQAVEQQQRVAAHAAVQVERAEAIVRGAEMRTASLKKLIERRLRESEANDARNEQKESDDRAVRASWNRLTAPGPARFL